MRGYKKTRFQRFVSWLTALPQIIKWWFKGGLLEDQIADTGSDERTDAQKAVDKVVWETDIAPDCVSAIVLRGGSCIYLRLDGAHEAIIAPTYMEAADKAIEWLNLQGEYAETKDTSKLNRRARREFDAKRKKRRGGRGAGHTRH